MTLESANICSKLLTRRPVRPRCSREPGSQVFAPAVRREGAALVAEAKTAATTATNIAMCSFQCRNIFSWELAFGLGSSRLDPKLGEKEMLSEKAEKCAHSLCSCVATSGKYCSAECQATEQSVKQRKRRRRSLARVYTPDAKARKPERGFAGRSRSRTPSIHAENWNQAAWSRASILQSR
jgi:hypothetical protein